MEWNLRQNVLFICVLYVNKDVGVYKYELYFIDPGQLHHEPLGIPG